MILLANPIRRPARPLRLILLAFGLAALPLSLRTLWAEPAKPKDQPAAQAAEEPAAVEEAQGEAEPEPKPDSAPAPASAPAANSIEQRLDRLEEMIESLVGQTQKRSGAATPKQFQFPKDVDGELSTIWEQAKLTIERAETSHMRKLAATRQTEALKAAWQVDTVTLDQLLEAQRRLVEAQTSYARNVCEMCADPDRRQYLYAAAGLEIANKALNEARQAWQQVTKQKEFADAENSEEAQAREQYYQFKIQTQTLLDAYFQEQVRYKNSQTADIANSKESRSLRHLQNQVEREREELAGARKKLAAARDSLANGEGSQDWVRELEKHVVASEFRLAQKLGEMVVATHLLLKRSRQLRSLDNHNSLR